MANSTSPKSIWDYSPSQAKEVIERCIMSVDAEKPDVFKVTDLRIKGENYTTPVRIYSPSDAKSLPIILMIHGGAWVAGNLDTHDNMARYLCRGAQALVVSVGYLNAPEGKFPQPLEQCYDALLWIVKHAQEYHADASQVAVVGDSAGGNMATALCLMTRDRNGPPIALQVLINPMIDLTGDGTLEPCYDHLDFQRWNAIQYTADPRDAQNPYVSPMIATDLSGLPPALIMLAENDPLRADGQKYARRLTDACVPTNVYILWGSYDPDGHCHVARASQRAQESLDVVIASLRGMLHQAAR